MIEGAEIVLILFIQHPSWKTNTLKGVSAAAFKADEDQFLMDVTVLDASHE